MGWSHGFMAEVNARCVTPARVSDSTEIRPTYLFAVSMHNIVERHYFYSDSASWLLYSYVAI